MKTRRWFCSFLLFFATIQFTIGCSQGLDSVKNIDGGVGEQIIVLGDSIASGYGVAEAEAFPNVLSRKLGLPILNQGVAGDTTAMGLNRLQGDVISQNPWLVMVELGGNDYLRKVPLAETEENLRQIITQIQQQGAIVVLLGINPGLLNDPYKEMFEKVAQETQAYLIPQIFKGVLDNPKHRQDDVIHPNAVGQEILASRVADDLRPLLKEAKWPASLMKYKSSTD
ncbi:GDSL-type esterase/lipase family protein [Lyngbya sp. PCC 8106]|uniref:GDSL-type esterase/lipase family protein n=1 Tax=Lyngbya sp. (strain PCC 8106) TaxID=313612 RepID=UPI0000EAB6DC|nr:GDSL-type esterase/lipase family protein [Lyngbya sp. PCC 8106]EAW36653.1 GDSL-like Lipase/Acylhydrolase family protein [Lyngbya sp. PCC 8106]